MSEVIRTPRTLNFDAQQVRAAFFECLVAITLVFLALSIIPNGARAQEYSDCEDLDFGYGPFDYTNPLDVRDKLPVVEKYHFTPSVESLVSGNTVANPMDDIDYTLRAFPNHHRALYSMVQYHVRSGGASVRGSEVPAICWLDRATSFSPTDGSVATIYGLYLHRLGRLDEALAKYKRALTLSPQSADLQYNLGLLYFDMSDYQSSRNHAIRAYELGYPLPGLQNKLKKVGQW